MMYGMCVISNDVRNLLCTTWDRTDLPSGKEVLLHYIQRFVVLQITVSLLQKCLAESFPLIIMDRHANQIVKNVFAAIKICLRVCFCLEKVTVYSKPTI